MGMVNFYFDILAKVQVNNDAAVHAGKFVFWFYPREMTEGVL
jgi:hypothetical protein